MPSQDVHLQFEKWAREYGPIYSLMLGTKCLIVLSSGEAVKELLDKRSNIYSHRQEMYIGQTLCSGGLRLLMMVSHELYPLIISRLSNLPSTIGIWANMACRKFYNPVILHSSPITHKLKVPQDGPRSAQCDDFKEIRHLSDAGKPPNAL
jgi:hypothetical protein